MWDDNLPSDTYFEVIIYEGGNPPYILSQMRFEHKWEDPPGVLRATEMDILSQTPNPLFLYEYSGGRAPNLREVLAGNEAYTVERTKRGIRFQYSLTPWLSHDMERTRIWVTVGSHYRRDLFTESHDKVMREHNANMKVRLQEHRDKSDGAGL